MVEGVIGKGYRGDIAIDDFKFKSGKCPTVPSDASPNNPVTTSAPQTTMRPTVPSNRKWREYMLNPILKFFHPGYEKVNPYEMILLVVSKRNWCL